MQVDGVATPSCVTSIDSVGGAAITTVEGLSPDRSHKVQQAVANAIFAATGRRLRSLPIVKHGLDVA